MSTPLGEPAWYPEREHLVARALAGALPDDLWCYFTLWRLGAEAPDDRDALIDELDRRLASALEEPTLWGALAASRAEALAELPTAGEARAAARELLPGARPEEALQLVLAGLVPSDDPALGNLMEHLAGAAARCLTSSWINSPTTAVPACELAAGSLWLATAGHLDDRLAAALGQAELRLWRQVAESPAADAPERLAWLLLL